MIPHSRPFLGQEEEAAAVAVIRSGHLSAGERVLGFERALAERIGVRHAVAVSSGTAALHLALLALGVGPGDAVAIPTYVCLALLQAVRYTGADPILVDSDPDTLNLDPADLRLKVTPTTRAVVLPHMFGRPADVSGVRALGIPVVEDCAMGLGADMDGRPAGSMGDVSVFSFRATKVIACGEGGMVATRDERLAEKVRDLSEYDGKGDSNTRFNYRMSDLQASVGGVQLGRLGGFVSRRRVLAARYGEALQGVRAALPLQAPGHIFYRYVIRVSGEAEGLIPAFERQGVAARRPVFLPIHLALGLGGESFDGATRAHRSALSLPLYPSLTDAEADRVIGVAREVLGS